MKSAFAYFGGKTGMAPRIVAMMPAHRVYIEPYFGSGAVLFAKPPSTFEIVNDLDDQLVNFWRVLRQRPDDLAQVCALTPHSRIDAGHPDHHERLAEALAACPGKVILSGYPSPLYDALYQTGDDQ